MSIKTKQLNPFELKTRLIKLLADINSVNDLQNCISDIELLDGQEDKTVLSKLLFKELVSAENAKIPVICFLLEHFVKKEDLISGLWETLNNKSLRSESKITILNLLRELDSDWSFEDYGEYLADAEEILDENTRQLLNNAIINPEVQIDFMDFMASIKVEDKITLINSFEKDFSDDALANILIPVFESNPSSPVGKEALRILGETKSQLALNVLEKMQSLTHGELNQAIRKSLATLKMSGMRVDNTKEFYKKILSNSKPDKFYVTYPDGHGDMAMICTRVTEDKRIRFISIVINIESGIKDCFGFFDISQFECDKILERFLKDEKVAALPAEAFKNILYNSEIQTVISHDDNWELPYEYVCWKNLLIDIDSEDKNIDEILKSELKIVDIDEKIFAKLEEMKVSSHWFLDGDYSDEFDELLKNSKGNEDLNSVINFYADKIFYKEEKDSWIKKLCMSAYIKLVLDKKDEAEQIYSLIFNSKLLEQFFDNLLKRSIYEYFMTIKYNKDMNVFGYSDDEIISKIDYIEKNWVK